MKGILLAILLFWSSVLSADQYIKVNSVKRLTHLLSKLEKSQGVKADFTTLRLQLHLEDVYISVGTTLYLDADAIAVALKIAVDEGLDKRQIAERLLRQFQRGDFGEN